MRDLGALRAAPQTPALQVYKPLVTGTKGIREPLPVCERAQTDDPLSIVGNNVVDHFAGCSISRPEVVASTISQA
jgi:hypothetical protein